jgi:hypothetical protein
MKKVYSSPKTLKNSSFSENIIPIAAAVAGLSWAAWGAAAASTAAAAVSAKALSNASKSNSKLYDLTILPSLDPVLD